ncbi:uncharacterized protein Dvar_18140 [Desulfosarcina variabilis str. Montpellier]
MRLAYGYSRFDGFDFSPRVSLQLKLPRLSKKALLIIGISDDDFGDPNLGIVLRLEADFGFINDIDVFKAVFGE